MPDLSDNHATYTTYTFLSVYQHLCLSICLSVYLSICLSISLFFHQPIYFSICPSIYLLSKGKRPREHKLGNHTLNHPTPPTHPL